MESLSGAWLISVLLSTTCLRKMSSGIGQQSVRRVLRRSKRPWHQQRYLPISTPMCLLVLMWHQWSGNRGCDLPQVRNGSERPIVYASKTLSDAERNYSQIEREALSIIFGVKKFHQFLYGRTFSLLTDHKPLITIFSPEKGIPTLVASRLQRWAIILSAYSYKIEYKPTKEHGNPDSLSRLPTGPDSSFENTQSLSPVINLIQDECLSQMPIFAKDVAKATEGDEILNQVMKLTQKGWPLSKKKLDPKTPSLLPPENPTNHPSGLHSVWFESCHSTIPKEASAWRSSQCTCWSSPDEVTGKETCLVAAGWPRHWETS